MNEELEEIGNANVSEAMESLKLLGGFNWHNKPFKKAFPDLFSTVKRALLKTQELEIENEILKEIIKSLFDKGCPLHQYADSEGVLQIEVDNECSLMHLGEFKGVNLDKKLKEVLK